MAWDPSVALDFYVALTLLVLSVVLLLAGRRRRETLALAGYLLLVAANFAGGALATATGTAAWNRLAYVALALDPVLFLGFAWMYPYPRRSRLLRGALAAMAVVGVGLAIGRLGASALAPTWEHAVFVVNLAVAYAMALALALHAALRAPTPALSRRGAWAFGAMGVAVVPRLALLPDDFKALPINFVTDEQALSGTARLFVYLGGVMFHAALVALALLLLYIAIRKSHSPQEAAARTAWQWMTLASVTLLGLDLAAQWPDLRWFRGNVLFGLRWILFGPVLVYGVLAFELVELEGSRNARLTVVGALLAGSAGFLLAYTALVGQGVGSLLATPVAAAFGFTLLLPAAAATRSAVRSFERFQGTNPDFERRIELYRAAIEVAWNHGPPNAAARRRLDRDRRAFGVTDDEARTLEYVVSTSHMRPSGRVALGEEILPGITVDQQLGQGSHGRVFLATRRPTGQRVILKEVRRDVPDSRARRRFLTEARALQRLDHPHIVRLRDVQVTGGRFLLVFDYVEGEPLSVWTKGRRVPANRVENIVRELLDGLAYAHARGIVHGDVKPENVLMGLDGHVRILDFSATAFVEGGPGVSSTASGFEDVGGFQGTLAYMAPEQVRGDRPSAAWDVYAVGLLAYELLAGRPAIDVTGCDPVEAMERVAHPAVDWKRSPREWTNFLRSALAEDPQGRPRTASELRRVLPAPG